MWDDEQLLALLKEAQQEGRVSETAMGEEGAVAEQRGEQPDALRIRCEVGHGGRGLPILDLCRALAPAQHAELDGCGRAWRRQALRIER